VIYIFTVIRALYVYWQKIDLRVRDRPDSHHGRVNRPWIVCVTGVSRIPISHVKISFHDQYVIAWADTCDGDPTAYRFLATQE
jgi:hypothetical protein